MHPVGLKPVYTVATQFNKPSQANNRQTAIQVSTELAITLTLSVIKLNVWVSTIQFSCVCKFNPTNTETCLYFGFHLYRPFSENTILTRNLSTIQDSRALNYPLVVNGYLGLHPFIGSVLQRHCENTYLNAYRGWRIKGRLIG